MADLWSLLLLVLSSAGPLLLELHAVHVEIALLLCLMR